MKLLNPGYDNESVGGSLYWNSKSGNCYFGKSNATTTCDFTSAGIKNDITRNLISETTFNLGGWYGSTVNSDFIYNKEIGTEVYDGKR